jgi:hypothetical protein
MSCPRIAADPPVGRTKRTSMASVVDLPAPFGPMKPAATPTGTWKESRSTARRRPNRLVNSRTAMAVSVEPTPESVRRSDHRSHRRQRGFSPYECGHT